MTLLILLGAAAVLIGGIWLLVVMFQNSVAWGIAGILIPIASLIFVVMHWQEARKPFLIQLAGVILYVAAMAMAGDQPAPILR